MSKRKSIENEIRALKEKLKYLREKIASYENLDENSEKVVESKDVELKELKEQEEKLLAKINRCYMELDQNRYDYASHPLDAGMEEILSKLKVENIVLNDDEILEVCKKTRDQLIFQYNDRFSRSLSLISLKRNLKDKNLTERKQIKFNYMKKILQTTNIYDICITATDKEDFFKSLKMAYASSNISKNELNICVKKLNKIPLEENIEEKKCKDKSNNDEERTN